MTRYLQGKDVVEIVRVARARVRGRPLTRRGRPQLRVLRAERAAPLHPARPEDGASGMAAFAAELQCVAAWALPCDGRYPVAGRYMHRIVPVEAAATASTAQCTVK